MSLLELILIISIMATLAFLMRFLFIGGGLVFIQSFRKTRLMVPAAILVVFIFIGGTAFASGKSGVWPVQLVNDGSVTPADTGASVFVIDNTIKRNYTGNVIAQFTGVTLSDAETNFWPPAPVAGISVYYANSTVKPESGSSIFDLINWTLITATGDTLLSGNTYYAFDVPADPAAPYTLMKFVRSGACPFAYGLRYSVSLNP